MKSLHNYCFYTFLGGDSDSSSDSSSLSNGVVIAIACVVSVIVMLLFIIIFIVVYIFVKKKLLGIKQPVVNDTVGLTSNAVKVGLESNPAYDTTDNVFMENNSDDHVYDCIQVVNN